VAKKSNESTEAEYTPEELASFGIWVEIGARDPDQQQFLDVGLSVTWERREPSGSPCPASTTGRG